MANTLTILEGDGEPEVPKDPVPESLQHILPCALGRYTQMASARCSQGAGGVDRKGGGTRSVHSLSGARGPGSPAEEA